MNVGTLFFIEALLEFSPVVRDLGYYPQISTISSTAVNSLIHVTVPAIHFLDKFQQLD